MHRARGSARGWKTARPRRIRAPPAPGPRGATEGETIALNPRLWVRSFRKSFDQGVDSRRSRVLSHVFVQVFDHALLRMIWHNHSRVAPDVYRANHPNHRRLKRYADRGLRHVLNLRGDSEKAHYLFEAESCAALGLELHGFKMSAKKLPKQWALLSLLDLLDRIEGPMLIHCKSGADRSGLVAAIVQIHRHGVSVAEAREQLSLWRLHFKWTQAGVNDFLLHEFARDGEGRMPFRAWVEAYYDRDVMMARFAALSLRERLSL